uniref:BED-type domain-containing protein n=1 Tax=Oryza meridionalis TaxID=40149 RepID=A0A0E0C2L3_9ORYZ
MTAGSSAYFGFQQLLNITGAGDGGEAAPPSGFSVPTMSTPSFDYYGQQQQLHVSLATPCAPVDIGPDFTELPDSWMSMLAALEDGDEDVTSGMRNNPNNGAPAAASMQEVNITGGDDEQAVIWSPPVDDPNLIRFADSLLNLTGNGLQPATTARPPSAERGRMKSSRRRRRSAVWQHMELDPTGKVASCRYCTKTLNAESRNGTSTITKHVVKCLTRNGHFNERDELIAKTMRRNRNTR